MLAKQAAEEELRVDRKAREEFTLKCAKLNAELLSLNVILEKPTAPALREESERGSTSTDRRRERETEEELRANRHKSGEPGRTGGDGRSDHRRSVDLFDHRRDELRNDGRRDYHDGDVRSNRQETGHSGNRPESESGTKKNRGNSLEPPPRYIRRGYEWDSGHYGENGGCSSDTKDYVLLWAYTIGGEL